MKTADYFGLASIAFVSVVLMVFIIFQYFRTRVNDRRRRKNRR